MKARRKNRGASTGIGPYVCSLMLEKSSKWLLNEVVNASALHMFGLSLLNSTRVPLTFLVRAPRLQRIPRHALDG